MWRTIGGGMACVALGLYAGRELVQKREQLQGWVLAMKTMEIHCACARETPGEILHAGAEYVPLLDALAAARLPQEQMDMLHHVPPHVRGVVAQAVREIVNGSQEEQLRYVRLAVSQLEMMLDTARKKCDRNVKLYVSLGLWGGLCTALILI